MNPALIAAMNFALNSKKAKSDDKKYIEQALKKIDNWYKTADKDDLKIGYVDDKDIEDLIYILYNKYNIKFDLKTGKWKKRK